MIFQVCHSRTKWLLIGAALVTAFAFSARNAVASDLSNLSVMGVCCSYHSKASFDERSRLNEINPGLGLNLKLTRRTWGEVLLYRNSFDANSVLLAYGGQVSLWPKWDVGIMGGYVSGYPKRRSPFFVVPFVEFYNLCRVTGYPGATYALQCKIWKFGSK